MALSDYFINIAAYTDEIYPFVYNGKAICTGCDLAFFHKAPLDVCDIKRKAFRVIGDNR